MAKKKPKTPPTAEEYRAALVAFCDGLEASGLVDEFAAGGDDEDAYTMACKLLGRKPKYGPVDPALEYPDERL